MHLMFTEIAQEDIPELTRVMTRAFDDDSQRFLGIEKGGPPGYDNGEFFRKWLFPFDESKGYKILLEDQIVGGFIIWIYGHGHHTLGTIFVDPDHQNRGIGARAWEFIESSYPEAKSWELGTPSYAIRNQYFYEQKCGFRKVREDAAPEHPGTSFIYRKDVLPGEHPTQKG